MADTMPASGDAHQKVSRSNGIKISPGRLVLYGILILGAVVAFVPFFWMVSTSLMTLGETITRQWLPETPQFENYVTAWNEAQFAKYFLNSVIITFMTVTGLVVTCTLAG